MRNIRKQEKWKQVPNKSLSIKASSTQSARTPNSNTLPDLTWHERHYNGTLRHDAQEAPIPEREHTEWLISVDKVGADVSQLLTL